jgi:hypothetical protein
MCEKEWDQECGDLWKKTEVHCCMKANLLDANRQITLYRITVVSHQMEYPQFGSQAKNFF